MYNTLILINMRSVHTIYMCVVCACVCVCDIEVQYKWQRKAHMEPHKCSRIICTIDILDKDKMYAHVCR